jgi:lipid A 4'-phosphatase
MTRTSRAALGLAAVAAIVFSAFPQIDLATARLFYDPAKGFPMAHQPVVSLTYRGITLLMNIFVPALIVAIAAGFIPRLASLRAHRAKLVYFLLVLAIGPGLIVNTILKDHWGRARPGHVTEFGGSARFTPALLPSDQCPTNCSFVSGHVAAAFSPAAVALILPRRRRTWLSIGVAGAALAGFSRMAAGSHFLSDVVFAVVVVWFTAVLLHRLLFRRSQEGSEDRTTAAASGLP